MGLGSFHPSVCSYGCPNTDRLAWPLLHLYHTQGHLGSSKLHSRAATVAQGAGSVSTHDLSPNASMVIFAESLSQLQKQLPPILVKLGIRVELQSARPLHTPVPRGPRPRDFINKAKNFFIAEWSGPTSSSAQSGELQSTPPPTVCTWCVVIWNATRT